jgi:hypothetical protein
MQSVLTKFRSCFFNLMRINVRILMVLIFCLGIGLSIVVRLANVQHEVVTAIRQAGGAVSYQWQTWDGGLIPRKLPWAPGWIVNRVGPDYFGSITSVYFDSFGSDDVMPQVGRLHHLESLFLNGANITDAGMKHLKEITSLKELYLGGTKITDSGLVNLKGMVYLRQLDIANTRVSDVGLERLKGLTGLQELDLLGTRISDAGLEHLKGMTQLRVLRISPLGAVRDPLIHSIESPGHYKTMHPSNGTGITAAGLANLEKLLPNVKIIQ